MLRRVDAPPQLGLRQQQRKQLPQGIFRHCSKGPQRLATAAHARRRLHATHAERLRRSGWLARGRRQAKHLAQLGGGHLQAACQIGHQLTEQSRRRDLRQQRPGLVDGLRAPLGGGHRHAIEQAGKQKFRQGLRPADLALEGFGAFFAHIRIRIVLGGQEQELHHPRIAEQRQGLLHRPARGAAARGIAVEAENHLAGMPKQLLQLLCRTGGTQRGHGLFHPELGERHDVHIAFDHQRIARARNGAAGLEQAVQLLALVEHRGFRRVEVFRFTLVDDASAKADDFAAQIANRKGDSVAQPVVSTLRRGKRLGLRIEGVAGRVAGHHQAGLHQGIGVVIRERAGQGLPIVRGVAQAKFFGDLALQATGDEVVLRPFAMPQAVLIKAVSRLQGVDERGLQTTLLLDLAKLLRVEIRLGHGHAVAPGQFLDRIDEAHARMLHQEADSRAMCAATEAVIELLARTHGERGRLLAVEGAQALVVGTGLFQLDILAHDLDDVGAGEQILNETGRNALLHGSVAVIVAAGAAAAKRLDRARLLGLHANGAIEPDDFAIEHAVGEDGFDQGRVFLGPSQTLRKRHHLSQRRLHLGRHAHEHRRLENAGRDGHDADTVPREIARQRQGHAGDASLGSGISCLAYLPVERRHRSGIDDYASFAIFQRRLLGHHGGGKAGEVEAANQIDVDHPLEKLQGMGALLAQRARSRGDAGATHRHPQRGQRVGRLHRRFHVACLRHIATHELAADVCCGCSPGVFLQIGDDHPHAP